MENSLNKMLYIQYYFFQINRWDLILNNELLIKFPAKELDEAISKIEKVCKEMS